MSVTTRFSLSELAEMLNYPVDAVRTAVESLSDGCELTAETFQFGERNWRVAPSDVKRIQSWIEQAVQSGAVQLEKPRRRIKSKKIVPQSDSNTVQ